MRKLFGYLRCMFNFHYWGQWSEPEHNRFSDSGGSYWVQYRYCNRCNKFKNRLIFTE